jgi:hypothetical protein
MPYLALVLICKDEGAYLEEWLDYHFSIGVDHVLLIDNGSDPPLGAVADKWVRRGLVTVILDADNRRGAQCRAYIRVMEKYGREFQWMGFIDTDEFLVPKTGQSLPELPRGYEEFGGLGVFWHSFGSNGHLTRQPSVIRAYTRRAGDEFSRAVFRRPKAPTNDHVKSIVQPRFTQAVARPDPHIFRHHEGRPCVDENGLPIATPRRWPRVSCRIQLNHYVVRSREEFQEKLKRGGPSARVSRWR